MSRQATIERAFYGGVIKSLLAIDKAIQRVCGVIEGSLGSDGAAPVFRDLVESLEGILEVVVTSDQEIVSQLKAEILPQIADSAFTTEFLETTVHRLQALVSSVPPSTTEIRPEMFPTLQRMNDNLIGIRRVEAYDPKAPPTSPTRETVPNRKRAGSKAKTSGLTAANSLDGPRNRMEARTMLLQKLKALADDFELVFQLLVTPDLANFARKQLLRRLTEPFGKPISTSQPADTTDPTTPVPISQTISFRSAEIIPAREVQYLSGCGHDFGQWPVQLAQQAVRALRQIQKSDAVTHDLVQKKLKELSVGFFTSTNQAPLLDKDNGVALYKARVTKKIRLIYQIDCGAPRRDAQGQKFESQFIRVYEIVDLTQINERLYRNVASELGRRGKEYQQRCATRATPRGQHNGIDLISPTTFPRGLQEAYPTDDIPPLRESDFLELHRILSLEKFIPFTTTFIEELQNRNEDGFVFAPSSTEDDVIRHRSSCLVLGRSGTGKTTTMLLKMIDLENGHSASQQPIRQLFLTQSRTLATGIQAYYTQLTLSSSQVEDDLNSSHHAKLSIRTIDNDSDSSPGGLPPRFSELDDSHFPLFLTFDQLYRLLEADLGLAFVASLIGPTNSIPDNQASRCVRQPMVTYDLFLSHVWPRLMRQDVDPAMVFKEFIGVIQGSEATLMSPKGTLSRDVYEALEGRNSSSSVLDRAWIYDLFELYKARRPQGSYDAAERTHALINALKDGVPGSGVDYLYVDEVQDNLLVDMALLKMLCRNPNGFFCAGDTAQTISAGSAFRFSELRSFLYRLEEKEPLVRSRVRKAINPEFFELNMNYRSHGGIVGVAAFLVQVLARHFPWGIDLLAPEWAKVHGPKPRFLTNRPDINDFLRILTNSVTGVVGLGAEQVILVRNSETGTRLLNQLGKKAIILSLYEAKGLEFDDVILFDFFGDSTATSKDWRAMANAEKHSFKLDPQWHAILQTELKSFYVALTRAKKTVWIWDTSDRGTPIEAMLVKEKHLCESHEPTEPPPQLGGSSDIREWEEKGETLLGQQIFTQAAFCFDKARSYWWRDVCYAYQHRRDALRLPEKDTRRSTAFCSTGDEFKILAATAPSADDTTDLYRAAAGSYRIGSDLLSAATCYIAIQRQDDAAHCYQDGKHYEQLHDLIQTPHNGMTKGVLVQMTYICKLVFSRIGKLRKARRLCESDDDFAQFLDSHGFHHQHSEWMALKGEYEAAGESYMRQGNTVGAVSQFLKLGNPGREKAVFCLVKGLQAAFCYGSSRDAGQALGAEKLLQSLRSMVSKPSERDEFAFYELLQGRGEVGALGAKACQYFEQHDLPRALLTFEEYLRRLGSRPLSTKNQAGSNDIHAILKSLRTYVKLVQHLCKRPQLLDVSLMAVVGMSFPEDSEGVRSPSSNFEVHPYSSIFASASRSPNPTGVPSTMTEEVLPQLLEKNEANRLFKAELLKRTTQIVTDLHQSASSCGLFSLCPAPQCNCPRHHAAQAQFEVAFNDIVRMHLKVISIIDNAMAAGVQYTDMQRNTMQSIWLSELMALCYPPTTVNGGVAWIVPDLILESRELLRQLLSWIRTVFYWQRPGLRTTRPNPLGGGSTWFPSFLDDLLSSTLLATALDPLNASQYIRHGPWSENSQLPDDEKLQLQQSNGEPIVQCALSWFLPEIPNRHHQGITFVEYVVEKRLPIDSQVLLAFVEEITAQLIFNHYYHYLRRSFNGLTLPRTWIIRALVRKPAVWSNGSAPYRWVTVLKQLLSVMMSGERSENLRYGSTPWPATRATDKCETIERVCRCLALLSINNNSRDLGASILSVLNGLKEQELSKDESLHSYFNASNMSDLSNAVCSPVRTTHGSTLVSIRTSLDTRRPLRPVAIVQYHTWADLMPKLMPNARKSIFQPQTERTRSETPESNSIGFADHPSPEALTSSTNPAFPSHSNPTPVDADVVTSTDADNDIKGHQINAVSYSDEQVIAIRLFQKYCKRGNKYRHSIRRGGASYSGFCEQALAIKDKTSDYKSLCYIWHLRGPGAHAVEHLSKLIGLCKAEQTRLNGLVRQPELEGWNDVYHRHGQATKLGKDLDELMRKLKPNSPAHKLKDILKLTGNVGLLPALCGRIAELIGEPLSNVVDDDYRFAVEFFIPGTTIPGEDKILKGGAEVTSNTPERGQGSTKSQKKPIKPALNVEDV